VGGFVLGIVVGLMVAVSLLLIGTTIWSIQHEKRKSGITRTWKNFGLSIAFCILFLVSGAAQGVAQWQTFTDEQRQHNQPVEVGDFTSQFAEGTLQNWQSEFLQLFSFVVLSAVLVHQGSAESRDSDDRMEEALNRIEKKIGTK
jgi:hypothetical protein